MNGNFAYAQEIMTFSQALNGAVYVYAANTGKPLYWLHSLVLVLLVSFGGGIFIPPLFGKPSIIAANDSILPIVLVAWYLVFNLGAFKYLSLPVVRAFHQFPVALYRTHSVIKTLKAAFGAIPAGPYYPVPLFGPIIVSTIAGCLSGFVTAEKPLSPIHEGTPWTAQAAFMTATLYHFIVNDRHGPVGHFIRGVIGDYTESQVVAFIAAVQIINLVSMILFSPDSNLLTPIHKVLYLIFQVNGPVTKKTPVGEDVGWKVESRIYLERLLEVVRVLFVLFILSLHFSWHAPPSSLPVGVNLAVGDSIGSCHLFQGIRSCQPEYLTFESALVDMSRDNVVRKLQNKQNAVYRFALYNGSAVLSQSDMETGRNWVRSQCASDSLRPVWSLNVPLDVSSTSKAKWQSFCEAEPFSEYPVAKKSLSGLCVSNGTTSNNLDPLDWGTNCKVSARLSKIGVLQVLLSNAQRQQEMLLWQSTSSCDASNTNSTSTAGSVIISHSNSTATSGSSTNPKSFGAVTCSGNKVVALTA